MKQSINTIRLAITFGSVATVVGLVVFVLHWNFWELWGGPFPGYQVFLYPGNQTLIYVWHPLFTEELALFPKLVLILIGQFIVTFGVSALLLATLNRIINRD